MMVNWKSPLLLVALPALVFASSGCVDKTSGDAVTDPTGRVLGRAEWTTIPVRDCALSFASRPDLIESVRANELPGRRQEQITLVNGFIVAEYMYDYSAISPEQYAKRPSEQWVDRMFDLSKNGWRLQYDEEHSGRKVNGRLHAWLATKPEEACFVFELFGEHANASRTLEVPETLYNAVATGIVCQLTSTADAEQTRQFGAMVVGQLRFDGGEINRSRQ